MVGRQRKFFYSRSPKTTLNGISLTFYFSLNKNQICILYQKNFIKKNFNNCVKNYLKINYVEFHINTSKDNFFNYIFKFQFIVDKFYFHLKLDQPFTNSKTCLKPLVQSTILQNVNIANTMHLRRKLLFQTESFLYKKCKNQTFTFISSKVLYVMMHLAYQMHQNLFSFVSLGNKISTSIK